MLKIALHIIVLFLFANTLFAQQPAYTYYSIRDGLPSNDIYNCVEDKKGFLWVATENGLSKFDGKNFKNYSVSQGLPDNDILNVLVDEDGLVWALPFQKSPSYYDEKNDCFISSKTNKALQKIAYGNINSFYALNGGGIGFCNSLGQIFIYKNGKCASFQLDRTAAKNAITHRVLHLSNNNFLIVSSDSLRLLKDNNIIAAYYLDKNILQTAFLNNNLYIADSSQLIKLSIMPNGSIGNSSLINLPFIIRGLNFSGKQIAISSGNGNIYLADTATLKFSPQGFSFNSLTRFVHEDKAGNTWICTKENGLIRYQQKGILTISEPTFQRNFSTISFFKNDLIVGTNDGQLLLYKGDYQHTVLSLMGQKNYAAWLRKLIPTKKGMYVAAEGGLFFINNNTQVKELFNFKKNIANKDCILVDDTTIIAGNSGMVSKVNLNTNEVLTLLKKRVTCLAAPSAQNIFIGSNDGLYNLKNSKTLTSFSQIYPLLATRVSTLCYNKIDEILWVGLATDSILAIYKNVPIAVIPLGANLPGNNCRKLFSVKKGIVWVGTNLALARINHTIQNNILSYKTTAFTTADGIAGKQINDIAEKNDTLYIATTAGISIMPSNLLLKITETPVYVTSVKINNIDTAILSNYTLSYTKNNITITYASADLGGSSERMYEYKINNGSWVKSKIETITLQQLGAGNYTIKVRALKRDGTASNSFAQINFYIKNPFWKTAWFLVVVFFGLIGIIFYFLQRRSRIKREESIQKLLTEKKLTDLELKALKAQINPHFVFNCLNSIKYLNHQKSFEETELYLDKFSFLLRKTLDFSGIQKITLADELAYSKNYLELEKLRLGNKLMYKIQVDEIIKTEKTLVPPMLLQPYLENAIKHGIRHLPTQKGLIIIDIQLLNNKIITTIKDNGIGINKALLINKNKLHQHSSLGTTLQQRRANLYNIAVEIVNGKNNKGTTVILTLQNENIN